MSELISFTIDASNVSLSNNIVMNDISVTIDLSDVWNRSSQYTDFYISAALIIPIIENEVLKDMEITLEGTYLVSSIIYIPPNPPTITLTGQCPGQIDTISGRIPTGTAKVLFYTVS